MAMKKVQNIKLNIYLYIALFAFASIIFSSSLLYANAIDRTDIHRFNSNTKATLTTYERCLAIVKKLNQNSSLTYTILRGSIIENYINKRFLDIRLIVYEKGTYKKVPHVFIPENEQGHYYAIVESGKMYDFVFEIPLYKSHLITLDIPRQQTFYPIYQQIDLSPMQNGSKRIGQHIRVQNTFFDIQRVTNNQKNKRFPHKAGAQLKEVKRLVHAMVENKNELSEKRLDQQKNNSVHLSQAQENKNYSFLLHQLDKALRKTDTLLISALSNSALEEDIYEKTFLYNTDSTCQQQITDSAQKILLPVNAFDSTSKSVLYSNNVLPVCYTDFVNYPLARLKAHPIELWRIDAIGNLKVFENKVSDLAKARLITNKQTKYQALIKTTGKITDITVYRNIIKKIFTQKEIQITNIEEVKNNEASISSFEYKVFSKGFSKNAIEILILSPIE